MSRMIDRWYYIHRGESHGPVSSSQLDLLAAAGELAPEDRVWFEGDDPAFGIHARAAIDFSNLPPVAVRSAAAKTGYHPQTGLIHDPEKFRQWQRTRRNWSDQTAPFIQEVFLKARIDLADWLDLDRNRPLILAGTLERIRQDPALRQFIQEHQRYGDEMVRKLWEHVEFMVENRRKYYGRLRR